MESLLWKPGHSVSLANLNTDFVIDLATFQPRSIYKEDFMKITLQSNPS